jgi:osmoprotectant transport system permease protein
VRERLFGPDLGRLTREHVTLVVISVLVAVLVGIPLGALAAAYRGLSHGILAVVGLLQTIPALALLAALIPLLGRIGTEPAIVALSLYALLPIVRNTATGLEQVPIGLKHAGIALGMTRAQRWRHVDLPLAFPVILAGIKTSAVLTVGTATIAAFIGAGGYGERIAQGLALNDGAALLAGAIPSAALAVLTQLLFEVAERLARGRRRS